MSVTSDGLQFNGYGYRVGADLVSKSTFNFIGSETYIKWKAHGAGYMGAIVGIANASTQNVRIYDAEKGTTTDHSYLGTTVISDDTWYYTRIKLNSDNTTYQSITATGNYDNSGGTLFITESGTITNQSDFQNGVIVAHLWDNYGGTASYMTLGEVKTTATTNIPMKIANWDEYEFDTSSSIRGWQAINASDMLVLPDPGT
ncbi:MAG: glutamine synthetase, partial [Nitrospirae bacterium]|nr:glutamine synthetase [Nitrospirota bacterium]